MGVEVEVPQRLGPKAVAQAADWEDLNSRIRACTRCRLCNTRTQAVPGFGDVKARLMFVGEAPGATEDRDGVPFVGAAGQFLTELLTSIGIAREEVFIANVLKCRPPNNRDPLEHEIEQCLPWLRRQVAWIKPQIVCTLGRFAMHALVDPALVITQAHGQFYKKGDYNFFVTYHPAAALYRPPLKEDMRRDFLRLGTWLQQNNQ
ncbi:MAG: uracil-DNA glycosylase [Candidatus Xenobia bacterium]